MTIPVRLRPALVCCLLAAARAWNPVKKRPQVESRSRARNPPGRAEDGRDGKAERLLAA